MDLLDGTYRTMRPDRGQTGTSWSTSTGSAGTARQVPGRKKRDLQKGTPWDSREVVHRTHLTCGSCRAGASQRRRFSHRIDGSLAAIASL